MITFLLNSQLIQTDESAGRLLLDFLRDHLRLTGTKEGCKEGDCGACTILCGQLGPDGLTYRSMTSCLMPLAEAHGRHIVTVEGLNIDGLNPVQHAMVERGGSQCGFCTPGFIVSMSGYILQAPGAPSVDGLKHAVSGNLCRCTGYASIIRASEDLVEMFTEGGEHEHVWNSPDRVGALIDAGMIPEHFGAAADTLAKIEPLNVKTDPGAVFIAGGTDLYVQRGEELPERAVRVLAHEDGLHYVRRDADTIRVGALTTFEQFAQAPEIRQMFPDIDETMYLIASLQVRNRASLGGNIINASPIGDMTGFLLSLGTTLTLEAPDGARREVAMRDFFLGYKTLDKAPEELLVELAFPAISPSERANFEKVSKRICLDIATVNSAGRFEVDAMGLIKRAWISVGGVAATPLFLEKTRDLLEGSVLTTELVLDALEVVDQEVAPISDVRGSADYKRLLARQLVLAHFIELFPGNLNISALLTPQDQNRGAAE